MRVEVEAVMTFRTLDKSHHFLFEIPLIGLWVWYSMRGPKPVVEEDLQHQQIDCPKGTPHVDRILPAV